MRAFALFVCLALTLMMPGSLRAQDTRPDVARLVAEAERLKEEGWTYYEAKAYQAAWSAWGRSLQIYKQLVQQDEDQYLLAEHSVHALQTRAAFSAGWHREAREAAEDMVAQARRRATANPDHLGLLGSALDNLGSIHKLTGNPDAVLPMRRQALEAYRGSMNTRKPFPMGLATTAFNIIGSLPETANDEQLALAEEAIALEPQMTPSDGMANGIMAELHRIRGEILAERGDREQAASSFRRALDYLKRIKNPPETLPPTVAHIEGNLRAVEP